MFYLKDILTELYYPPSTLRTILYNVLSNPSFNSHITVGHKRIAFPMSKLFELNPNVKWLLYQEGFGSIPKSLAHTNLYIACKEDDDKIFIYLQ